MYFENEIEYILEGSGNEKSNVLKCTGENSANKVYVKHLTHIFRSGQIG